MRRILPSRTQSRQHVSNVGLQFAAETTPLSGCGAQVARFKTRILRGFCSLSVALSSFVPTPTFGEDIIVCGWDEVFALRIEGTNMAPLWKWNATNSDLPTWCLPLFATTDECKPCPGGKLLITSSGGSSLNGGVALVEPRTSNVLFYARAANAHSAELLPGDRVVVALSYHTNGNRLAVFNLQQSDVELFSVPLPGAHGVVWDEQRKSLWALANSYVREFKLQDWDSAPQLSQVSTTGLLEGDGHDFYPVANTPYLTVTTATHCWLFNRDTRTFTKHPLLGDVATVKGLSVHPDTGRIAYIQADGPWWSESLRLLSPQGTLHFPGGHLYKVRWLPTPQVAISSTSSNTTVVRWPSTLIGFSLQQSTTPDSTNWVAPTESVQDNGVNRFITIPATNGQRFYRLSELPP